MGIQVDVYTGTQCEWCTKVIDLLVQKGYTKMRITNVKGNEAALTVLGQLGVNTVPQVFIDGKHIGGYEDTKAFLKQNIRERIYDK